MARALMMQAVEITIDFNRTTEAKLENDFYVFLATEKIGIKKDSRPSEGIYKNVHTKAESWKIEKWLKQHGISIED